MAPAVRSCLADSTHSTDRETRSTSAFGLLDSKAPMRIFSAFSRRFNLLGRLTLTAAVGAAAAVSLYLVSGSVKTVEDIDRTDDTLAELSQYIAEGHASIRGLVATPGSSADAALLSFEKAVDRRIARLRTLNSQIEQRAAATVWSQPLQGSIDVQRIDEERRAYVSAGETAPTVGVEESPKALRLLDLHARKLIVRSAIRLPAVTSSATAAMPTTKGRTARTTRTTVTPNSTSRVRIICTSLFPTRLAQASASAGFPPTAPTGRAPM